MSYDPVKIKPIGKKILVKQNKKQETTSSGIILKQYATKNKQYIQTFTVINVGSKVTSTKPGDIVNVDWDNQIKKYNGENGIRLAEADDQYFLFDEDSVIGIWDEMPKFD